VIDPKGTNRGTLEHTESGFKLSSNHFQNVIIRIGVSVEDSTRLHLKEVDSLHPLAEFLKEKEQPLAA
jgi:hypothetical protein